MHSATHTVLKIASYSVVPSLCSLPGKTKPVDLFTFQTDVATRKLFLKLLLPPLNHLPSCEKSGSFFVCKSNHSLTHYNKFRIPQPVLQDTIMSSGSDNSLKQWCNDVTPHAFIVFLHWSIQELVKYMLQADEVVDLHHPLQADSRQDAVTLSLPIFLH